jgi:peptidoglycan/LPS O-acetylase OafA/YrhL
LAKAGTLAAFVEAWNRPKEQPMSLGTILLIILILMLVGILPTWPHSASWGYGPSGVVGVIVLILLILLLTGRL